MPSQPPDGEAAPEDGALPDGALHELGDRPLGLYVHVPFCVRRCGYCDFNTYTDLDGQQADYAELAAQEVRLARSVLGSRAPQVDTVFFGGGTPTVLPPEQLAVVLLAAQDAFGLAPDAEVTTEANPESVDLRALGRLRRLGFTRMSFGMQSAMPHVLATLDRVHAPGRPEECVREARLAGFEHVSLDLIYGAPGESLADWRATVDAALAAGPDHISAYALVVEPGTALAAKVARGELPPPDDDDLADKYLLADELLVDAGYDWYEVSNWARPGGECRHNLGYWRSDDWWGVGPGAHSHVGGVRWWNVRHPTAYAGRLREAHSPAQAREVLDVETRRVERVLLQLRLAEGLPVDELYAYGRRAAEVAVGDGLLRWDEDRLVLSLRGRLLADAVVRNLVD